MDLFSSLQHFCLHTVTPHTSQCGNALLTCTYPPALTLHPHPPSSITLHPQSPSILNLPPSHPPHSPSHPPILTLPHILLSSLSLPSSYPHSPSHPAILTLPPVLLSSLPSRPAILTLPPILPLSLSLQISRAPTSLLFAWAVPNSNGAPVTNYHIEISGGHMNSHMIFLVAMETQHLMEDLQPNVTYRLATCT